MEKKLKVLRVNVPLVKVKIYGLLVVLLIDLILSTFVEYTLSGNLQEGGNFIFYIAMMGYPNLISVQVSFRVLLMLIFILLLWSTFVFTFGMVREIMRNFKFTFLIIVVDLILHVVERAARIVDSSHPVGQQQDRKRGLERRLQRRLLLPQAHQ